MDKEFRRRRVLFVAPTRSPFILHDAKLLARSFDTHEIYLMGREQLGRRYLIDNAPKVVELVRAVRWADVVFSWFADFSYWPMRLAKSMGKKSVVVLGGYDVAAEREFGYGALLSEKGRRRVSEVLNCADAVLPVNVGLCEDVYRNLGLDTSRFRIVATGYDSEMFRPMGRKERMVMTMSSGSLGRGQGLRDWISSSP